jgi:hypothetical protein
MTNFAGLYDIRDFKPEDKNFILASFLKGLYYGDSWFSLIPKSIFMENYKKVAEALLDPNKTNIKVACLKEDTDVIIGYSIMSLDFMTLHWVYVKSSKLTDGTTWRQKGIGRSLVPQHPTAVSHLTALGKNLLTKLPTAIFNPFSI